MLISEAFNLYRDDYIRLRNQSRRTEETHETCKNNTKNTTLSSINVLTFWPQFANIRVTKHVS